LIFAAEPSFFLTGTGAGSFDLRIAIGAGSDYAEALMHNHAK
jgi:hypothetical protein